VRETSPTAWGRCRAGGEAEGDAKPFRERVHGVRSRCYLRTPSDPVLRAGPTSPVATGEASAGAQRAGGLDDAPMNRHRAGS